MKITILIIVTVAIVGEMISFASAATNLGTSWECDMETGKIIARGKHYQKTCNTYCKQVSVPKARTGYCKEMSETGYCFCNWITN